MRDREVLTAEQVAFYRTQGYILLEERVPMEVVEGLRAEIARIVEEARGLEASNDRIDLEDSHRPDDPKVRRIKRPHVLSDVVADLMRSEHILAPVRDLLGPDVRLHGTKLNMKSAGYGAAVEWHQDFAFYPHTNDDLLAVGVFIDDMEIENGPLMAIPGSHAGPLYDHHARNVFVGALDARRDGLDLEDAVPLVGPAGTISLHHVRLVHGSALNTSARDRRLLLYEMAAADAFPVMGSMTSYMDMETFDSLMLCGEPTLRPRLSDVPVRVPQPQPPENGSIYEVQTGLSARSFNRLNQR
jgi:ectoine hydroxylase-related dioxygenase (phytanoyl-CoA dioxygenase family)